MDAHSSTPRRVGRYEIHREIASGGMASVHMGRMVGEAGFSRAVAIKRLKSAFGRDSQFAKMLADEARLASRIRHPNVVPVIDVVSDGDELLLVMEYVHGESLSRLLKDHGNKPLQSAVAVSILVGTLYGLHAAHEAADEQGRPLGVVHCDVTPQNILVGVDGVARVTDFGIAIAHNRLESNVEEGYLQGKLAYMAPEQLSQQRVDRRVDVYSAAVVLWEALTAQRLFDATSASEIVQAVLEGSVSPPSQINPSVTRALDEVVMRGLSADPDARFSSAREMAVALERAVVPAPTALIADFVERTARSTLEERRLLLVEVEGAGGHASATRPPPGVRRSNRPAPSVAPGARQSGTDFQVTLARRGTHRRPEPARVGIILAVGIPAIAIGAAAAWWFARPSSAASGPTTAAPAVAVVPIATATPTGSGSSEATPSAAPAVDAAAPPRPTKPADATKPTGKPKKDPGFGDLTRF